MLTELLGAPTRTDVEYVRSCDKKPYLHDETKGGICIKIEFNPQNNISLLQHGRHDVMWTHSIVDFILFYFLTFSKSKKFNKATKKKKQKNIQIDDNHLEPTAHRLYNYLKADI